MLEDVAVTKRENPLAALLNGGADGDSAWQLRLQRCGPYALETSEAVREGESEAEVLRVRCRMPEARLAAADKLGWIDLTDDVEAAVLEVADGAASVADVVAALARSEEGVGEQDVLARIANLWDRCLLMLTVQP